MSQEGYGISPLSKERSKGKSVRVRCYSKESKLVPGANKSLLRANSAIE